MVSCVKHSCPRRDICLRYKSEGNKESRAFNMFGSTTGACSHFMSKDPEASKKKTEQLAKAAMANMYSEDNVREAKLEIIEQVIDQIERIRELIEKE